MIAKIPSGCDILWVSVSTMIRVKVSGFLPPLRSRRGCSEQDNGIPIAHSLPLALR
jgi:hypothetical protein